MWKTQLPGPVGILHAIASDRGLCALLWADSDGPENCRDARPTSPDAHPVLGSLAKQLEEYFAGTRQVFDLPLEPAGTAFQIAVWNALRKIPYGETRSYAEQAQMIGNPAAVRAVGGANGKNPISIIIPCHRVIGKNGSLTGFGGGLPVKKFLLDHERRYATDCSGVRISAATGVLPLKSCRTQPGT